MAKHHHYYPLPIVHLKAPAAAGAYATQAKNNNTEQGYLRCRMKNGAMIRTIGQFGPQKKDSKDPRIYSNGGSSIEVKDI